MKKKHFLSLFALFAIMLASCKKETSVNPVSAEVNIVQVTDEVNAWLKTQNSADEERNLVITAVKNNLDFDNVRFEELNKEEKMIIVPVKNGFKSAVNQGKYLITNLLMVVNKSGVIRKGNIVQFIPKNGTTLQALPPNTFNKFYNAGKMTCDGRFTFLNLHDKLLYQMDYANGNLSAYGEKQVRAKSGTTDPTSPVTNLTNCVDWYLVTTIYYGNGTSSTTEEYMYTTCSAMQDEMEPQDTGGGGGGNQCSEDFNNLVSNTSVANDMITSSGIPDPNSEDYIKTFRWRAIKNLTWAIFSTEHGLLRQTHLSDPNLAYKFVSLDHFSLDYAGLSIGGTVTPTLTDVAPYVGIYNAGMQLIISVQYAPLGCPYVVPISIPYNCSAAFSAN